MSKTWKWILGILLVVIVIAAFAAIGFAWRTHFVAMDSFRAQPNWNGPMMGRGDNNQGQPGMWQRNDGWEHPMMYERGFAPHRGFSVLGGLVKFALFVGLLYGAYWLGRRNARIALDPAPAASLAEPSAAPEAEPASPSPEAESASAPRKRGKKLA